MEYYIVYWSQTGNTKEMAEAIGKGIEAAGAEANIVEVGNISAEELKTQEVFALGCPAMGAESLEESEMEPFVANVESFASGKKIALFGSYGWGGGEWMREWETRMKNAGAQIVNEEGVICNETPDDDTITACMELGKKMTEGR